MIEQILIFLGGTIGALSVLWFARKPPINSGSVTKEAEQVIRADERAQQAQEVHNEAARNYDNLKRQHSELLNKIGMGDGPSKPNP